MIKVFRGEATDAEKKAIELALTLRATNQEPENDYGKPILRGEKR